MLMQRLFLRPTFRLKSATKIERLYLRERTCIWATISNHVKEFIDEHMGNSVRRFADRMAGRLYGVPRSGWIDSPPSDVCSHLLDLAFCDGPAKREAVAACPLEGKPSTKPVQNLLAGLCAVSDRKDASQ